MPSISPILSVRRLSVSFKTEEVVRNVVRDISFDLFPGKTTAIVGESGSGKSVSSLSLINLLKKSTTVYDDGAFVFHWNDMENTLSPGDRALNDYRGSGIAMIFQEPMTALNPVMKCGKQLMEVITLHTSLKSEEAKARAIELFNEVKLPRPEQMFGQYPHELSGGQRQRVMIAMALAGNPKILIADEPTTALDVTVQKSILDLLRSLIQKYNMSMVFISHDLGVVKSLADFLVVMKNGDIVESGLAAEVLDQPKHEYTKGLLNCKPIPGIKLHRLRTLSSQEEPKIVSTTNEYVEPFIQIKNLNKTYSSSKGFLRKTVQEVRAVNEVSFEIMKGETLGLVGESGCGKSTLSRMLLGLIPATSGEVLYEGQNILEASSSEWKKLRKDLQIIFQDPYSALNPKHTVGDILMEPLSVLSLKNSNEERKQRVLELLDQVGLPKESLNRYPHEFSGGQRQRIVIARALSVEPKFIICDESVAALDVSVQAQVLNLLNDLKRELGLTYLFISHDLSVVYQMSDRIMVMNKGQIEELNTAWEIFYNPQSEYTKQLLASTV